MSGTDQGTYAEFSEAGNLTARELERWLGSDETQEVGQKKDDSSESTRHTSGQHVLAILGTKKADPAEDEHAHLRTVVGYVKRHQTQRPVGDVTKTRWRYSLMNRGHDPLT